MSAYLRLFEDLSQNQQPLNRRYFTCFSGTQSEIHQ